MSDLSDSIEDNAGSPKRATNDSGSFESHSLPDQIAADKYLASKAASKLNRPPIRMFKARPPGAVDIDSCR
jgi:hypothetical protein